MEPVRIYDYRPYTGSCEVRGDDGKHLTTGAALVLASDYDALLSVLRQCVEAMDHALGSREKDDRQMVWEIEAGMASAAARPYLERKEGDLSEQLVKQAETFLKELGDE